MCRNRSARWIPGVLMAVALAAGCSSTVPSTRAAQPEETSQGSEANFAPAAERRFIRVGATDGRQFTDDQYRYLSENFEYVLFTKFHGGYDITAQHESARVLNQLNPQVKVFPYFSTKYWFEQNKWGGEPFRDEWLLRDQQGEVVHRSRKKDAGDDGISYVDLANPEYREWALQTLRSWLDDAPYAGISFDAAEPIGDFAPKEVARWEKLLGPGGVKAYNLGMRTLLADAKKLAGPDREILFNGIAPDPTRGPDRNLDLLESTDGALDERFCLNNKGEVNAVEDDLQLMAGTEDRKLFMHTNYPDDRLGPGERPAFGRMCLGSFLLGWEPGRSYFRFGDDYTADQLAKDLPEMNVPLGNPEGPYRREKGLFHRSFANGEVYVNLNEQDTELQVEQDRTPTRGGKLQETVKAGSTVEVPGHDAVFLLKPS